MLIAFGRNGARDTDLVPKEYSWEQLAQRLAKPSVGPKDGSYLIRGGRLKEPKRADENLLEAELLIVDGDSSYDPETGEIIKGAPPIEMAKAALDALHLRYIIHTSFSFVPGEIWKYRIFIPAKIKNTVELSAAVDLIIDQLNANGCPILDVRENHAMSQAWYLPRCKPEYLDAFKCFASLTGKDFDVNAAMAVHRSKAAAEATVTQAREAPAPEAVPHGPGPIDTFNRAASINLVRHMLESAGYKFAFRRGDTLRFMAPQSETKTAGVTVFKGSQRGDIVAYSHHGAHDPLSGKLTDAFGILWHVVHRGNQEAAMEEAKRAINWKKKDDPLTDFDTIEIDAEDFQKARAANEKPAGPLPKIKTVSLVDLLEDDTPDEPDYIAPDFLGPGNFCLIAGPPKAQKSFLLTDMLVAAATGGPFLGTAFHATRPLKVFYLQAEMNRKLLKRRAKMLVHLNPAERQLLRQNLAVTERFAMILNPDGVKVAIESIRQAFPDGPDIIAIDPLANLFDGESEDKAPEVMQFLTGRIEAIRRAVNPMAAVILVHHSGKKSTEDMARDPFVAIRGSGALRGYYDTGIVIFRKSEDGPERRVHFELRNGESPEPMTVKLNHLAKMVPVETVEEGISSAVADRILDDIKAAWRSGKPLSLASQTRAEGRHVGRAMAVKYGMVARDVENLVQAWLYNGVCSVEIIDQHTKLKGIKVIGSINSKV